MAVHRHEVSCASVDDEPQLADVVRCVFDFLCASDACLCGKAGAVGLIPVFGVIGFVLWMFIGWPRVRARRRALPLLARSLKPLNPSRNEIDDALRWAKVSHNQMAKLLTIEQIERALAAVETSPMQNIDDLNIEEWGQRLIREHVERQRPRDDEPPVA